MDIANLQIKADSRQVKQAVKALKGLGIEAEVTERKNKKLKKSQFELNDVFGKSIFTIKNLIGTYIGFNALRIADQFTLIKARVAQSTDSLQDANKAFRALQKGAVETGSSLEASIEIFQRLSFSRKEIEATTDEMLGFTKAVQQLGVVSGASGVALDAGLKQLGQALSSNVFRAEEFNSLLENIPAVANEIAAGLGVTTGQLRTLVIEGKLASKDVFDVIIASTDIINEKFEQFKKNNPLSFAFSQLSTSFQVYLGQLNQSIGLTSFLADVTRGLAENLKIVGSVAIIAAAAIGGYILASNIGAVTGFTTAIIGNIAAFVSLAVTVRSLSGAMALLNATFLLNPIGLVVAGIAAGTAAFVLFKDEIFAFLDDAPRLFSRMAAIISVNLKLAWSDLVKFLVRGYNFISEGIKDLSRGVVDLGTRTAIEPSFTEDEIMAITGKGRFQKLAGVKRGAEQLGPSKLDFLEAQRQQKLNDLMQKYKGVLGSVSGETNKLAGSTKNLKDTQEASGATIEKSKSALQQYGEEARNVTDQLQDMGVRGIKSLEDNLVGLIRGTVSVADAFRSMADQIIEDLIRIQVKKSITEPLSGALESFLPSIGSALFGGGGVTASSFAATQAANVGSGLYGPGFASGGSFTVGGIGGPDSQLIPLRLTPGETVNVRKGGQQEQRAPQIIINNNAPQAQVSAGVGANGFDINVVIDDAFANNASRRGTKTFAALNNLGTPLSRG